MNKQLRELERRFLPGYRFVDVSTVGAHVAGPDGSRVRINGKVLQIAVSDASAHRLRRAVSLLQQAGVIAPERRGSRARHRPQALRRDAKSVLLLASETLRDPRASPRERRLAREVLEASERTTRLAEMVRRLGGCLHQAEAVLDAEHNVDAA